MCFRTVSTAASDRVQLPGLQHQANGFPGHRRPVRWQQKMSVNDDLALPTGLAVLDPTNHCVRELAR